VIKGRLDPAHTGTAPEAAPGAEAAGPDAGLAPSSAAPDGDQLDEPGGGAGSNGAAKVAVAPTDSPPPAPSRPPTLAATPVLSVGTTGVSLTFDELVEASGLDESAVRDLERYGLIVGRPVARTVYYDEESLVVGRLAAEFRRFGVEARHLRMYKTAAERESGFFEQIVTPLLKQRNPRARGEAMDTARDLSELGGRLRESMLRLALRDLTGG
jgi:hypothetical protein